MNVLVKFKYISYVLIWHASNKVEVTLLASKLQYKKYEACIQ